MRFVCVESWTRRVDGSGDGDNNDGNGLGVEGSDLLAAEQELLVFVNIKVVRQGWEGFVANF